MSTSSSPAMSRCVVPNTREMRLGPLTMTCAGFAAPPTFVALSTCSAVLLTRSRGWITSRSFSRTVATVAGALAAQPCTGPASS